MRFIFVGGCARSGTTLVQRALTAHSLIAGGPELVFTPHIAELYRRMAGQYPPPWAERVATHFDDDSLRRAFQDLVSGFFTKLGNRKPRATFVSEKTPANIREAATLLGLFPDSLFVHVLRDGRDVLASHRDVRYRMRARPEVGRDPGGFGWRSVSRRWNQAVDTHFELTSLPKLSPRYRALRYEELVADPVGTLTGLMDHVGVDFEPAQLDPGRPGTGSAEVTADGLWFTQAMLDRGFDTSSVGRWRQDLSLVDRLAAGASMRRNLRRLSYL